MDHKNGMDKFDALDAQDREVVTLLSALPRVEAPENFNFRVKARIAEGRPARGGFFPYLKVAAPLALVLLVVGLVVFYGTLGPSENPNPVVATATLDTPQTRSSEPARNETAVVSGPQVTEDPITPERASSETLTQGPVRRVPAPKSNTRPEGGGSVDSTLVSANTIMPRGLQSANPSRSNSNANDEQADIPIQDVLGILGISADFSGDGWKVKSAVANGTGYRAGIRDGDVIEAIDGQALSRDTRFKSGFNGKSLRVRRDGKSMSFRLGN